MLGTRDGKTNITILRLGIEKHSILNVQEIFKKLWEICGRKKYAT